MAPRQIATIKSDETTSTKNIFIELSVYLGNSLLGSLTVDSSMLDGKQLVITSTSFEANTLTTTFKTENSIFSVTTKNISIPRFELQDGLESMIDNSNYSDEVIRILKSRNKIPEHAVLSENIGTDEYIFSWKSICLNSIKQLEKIYDMDNFVPAD